MTGLLWMVWLACEAPVAGGRLPHAVRPFDAAAALRGATWAPLSPGFDEATPRPPLAPPAGRSDPLAQLGASLTGGRFDSSLGADLLDALADQDPDEVAEYGAGVLTLTELYGEDFDGEGGVCEDPHALFTFTEAGQDWELDLHLFGFLQVMEPVVPLWMTLSPGCAAAVDTAAAVDAAVDTGDCTAEEALGFFPSGGDCRACVEAGAQVADCVAVGACAEEVPLVADYLGQSYEWAETEVLACAPDVHAKLFLAAYDLGDDGSVPAAWDHTGWAWLCFVLRNERTGVIERSCIADGDGYDDLGDGVGEGVVARIQHLRPEGSSGAPHAERVAYARRLGFDDGRQTEEFLLSFGGIGQISAPLVATDCDGDGDVEDDDWGCGYGGWGMNPTALRPDGTDPDELDHTFARDWLGAVVTKMSTTRDGVPINNINHSRCAEWAGPHDDGSYTCTVNGSPTLGWFVDNHVFWYNRAQTRVLAEPMMTLGSTGLADPQVPGGVAVHLAGTAELALPTWDGCLWPDTFVADHIRTEDIPMDWGGVASLDAHTYRFGKDPDQDLRMVLATPQERGFCPPSE